MLRKKLIMITSMLLTSLALVNSTAFAGIKTEAEDNFRTSSVYSEGDLIASNNFDDGKAVGWDFKSLDDADADFNLEDGKCNVIINKSSTDRWAVQLNYKNFKIEKNHTYNVQFEVTPTEDCKVYSKIGDIGDPYYEYWNNNWNPIELKKGQTTKVNQKFTMNRDYGDKCELSFHLTGDCGAISAPWTVSFDNVHVYDDEFPGYSKETELNSPIKVNQSGYYKAADKSAVVNSDCKAPIEWKLLDSDGEVVCDGMTKLYGNDKESGEFIHLIDFTDFRNEGNYTLEISEDNVDSSVYNTNKSATFAIADNTHKNESLYKDLSYRSLKYFYLNRSALGIKMPYADDEKFTRNASYSEEFLNGSLKYVDKSIDVRGGWLQGPRGSREVDESAFATWMLQNLYESSKNSKESWMEHKDKELNIPESNNDIPDILEEARWNMEFLLKMQIKSENEYKGMVFDNIYAEDSSLKIKVPEDPGRYLSAPTTNATLDFAAVAAQASRLWKDYDSEFSDKCLKAAKQAWRSAVKYPDMYKGDNNMPIDDEFYFAACELYATTGEAEYLNYVKSSQHFITIPTTILGDKYEMYGTFDKNNVQALGTLSLLASNKLDGQYLIGAKENIRKAGEQLLNNMKNNGYGAPILESSLGDCKRGYQMNSNLYISNAAVILAYASYIYDNQCEMDYPFFNGVLNCMNYLLGRNPNGKSYITGYGTNPVKNPSNLNLFEIPEGCFVSGPSSDLGDSVLKTYGININEAPTQKCYVDSSESWSTNSVSLSNNASLSWITNFIADNEERFGRIHIHDIRGDVNLDEKINIKDYIMLQKYIVGNGQLGSGKQADINYDGKINVTDLLILKKMILN